MRKKLMLKDKWNEISMKLIEHSVRVKAFLIMTSVIFSIIGIGCTIVNFLNNEIELGIISSTFSGGFALLAVAEIIIFDHKSKANTLPFEMVTTVFMFAISILYMFFAPEYIIYLVWITIIPIFMCLYLGRRRGLIASAVLLLVIILIFYVPAIDSLTKNAAGGDDVWFKKSLFILYYTMSAFIGYVIAFVNGTIVRKLEKIKDIYYQDANTDNLTGLKNQAYYLSYVNNLHAALEKGETIGLMFIDIDDFKLYNDKYGHAVGNEILIEVAKKLNEIPHTLCSRWGGDEFAILERNLTKDELIAKANYLLTSVAGIKNGVTISIGLAYYTIDEDFDFEKIFNEADMQAIRAKGKGKNCIVISEK